MMDRSERENSDAGARRGLNLASPIIRDGAGLAAFNRDLIAKAEAIDSPHRVVLDMDSTEIPVYGGQEQSGTTAASISPVTIRCCCLGKGRVTTEDHLLAPRLLPLDLGQQQFFPTIGAVGAEKVKSVLVRR